MEKIGFLSEGSGGELCLERFWNTTEWVVRLDLARWRK